MPGLIKIGCSRAHPLERTRQLSASTSTPTPFVLAFHRRVRDPFGTEALIHQRLNEFRANESREFFRVSLRKAIEEIERFEEVVEEVAQMEDEVKKIPLPWAELFASFPDNGDPRELSESERARCRQLEEKLRTP